MIPAMQQISSGELAQAVRKVVVSREEVLTEGGRPLGEPVVQAVVAAVIQNPWVGTPTTTDLQPETAALAPLLAKAMVDRLVGALGSVEGIEAFGKGAIVGSAGEIEHGGALIHTPFYGNLVREFLAGESIICFADMRAGAGETLVVPMWHKVHAATRSHYQTVSARVPDAPRADEIVILVAGSTGARPHPRIGDRTTDPTVTAATVGSALS